MNLLAELRRRWLVVVLALVFALAIIGPQVATFYTDILWFRSVGYADRFFDLLYTRFGLGLAGFVVMALLVGVNLFLAQRLAPDYRVPSEGEEIIERYREVLEPFARPLLTSISIVLAFFAGTAVVGEWRTYLLWANGSGFGIDDPHFGIDLGFFVFDLPFLSLVNGWLFGAIAVTIVATAAVHYLFGGIRPQSQTAKITPRANIQLSVLLASLVAVRAWGFWLDRYMLSYSERGTVTGLSYTDVNAELRALELLAVIAAVCVVLFLANIRYRGWVLPSAGVGILAVAAILLGGAYPAAIQALQVNPQELPREREFIQRNLDYTRYAYDIASIDEDASLDAVDGNVQQENFPATEDLEVADIVDNSNTLEAIRLWDPATLQNTYNQLQELRPYYDFRDVDVDRYEIDGDPTQVMISVRELNSNDLTEPSWQNRALLFTHGYGVVSSTVSTAASNGQPEFLARDIPNEGVEQLDLDVPQIYFGEVSPTYSIVGTEEDEFDFENDSQQVFNRYDGEDGVPVGGLFDRIAFAIRYAEPNILLSGLINDESRILYNRRIAERVELIAPFLELDHDPYPVVVDGRVKWIQDAYTTTDMVPYSQRIELGDATQLVERQTVGIPQQDGTIRFSEQVVPIRPLQGQANYIRNSVKVVVDAYDGTTDLYVVDEEDPLIQAWGRAFPNVLKSADEIPEGLEAHFRYPEDMFRVQSDLLNRYHIPDADGFYNSADEWEIPTDSAFADNNSDAGALRDRTFPPTYQLLRLPGEEDEDFALIQPFTPVERDVLSAYLAAEYTTDGPRLRLLNMPPNRTVFGPEQVFARINQDSEVSREITLLSQAGSDVIYGNLIVVPVEDSLLYAMPLFLRAQQSDIPELREVIMVYGDEVVMEGTLQDSLEALFGELPEDIVETDALPEEALPDDVAAGDGEDQPAPDPDASEGEAGVSLEGDEQELLARAIELFAQADQALADGDLGEYQDLVDQAEEVVGQLNQLIGVPEPTAAPSPPPDASATPDASASTPDGG